MHRLSRLVVSADVAVPLARALGRHAHIRFNRTVQPTNCIMNQHPPDDRFSRCLIPDFDGAFLSRKTKDGLWDRFYIGAPHDRDDPSSDTT